MSHTHWQGMGDCPRCPDQGVRMTAPLPPGTVRSTQAGRRFEYVDRRHEDDETFAAHLARWEARPEIAPEGWCICDAAPDPHYHHLRTDVWDAEALS